MSLPVIWTPGAEQTFNEQIDYMEARWPAHALHRFVDRVFDIIELIGQNPLLYPVFDPEKQIRRCVLNKRLSLYYKHTNDGIYLLLFWPNRQNPEELPL